jgi:hypothetical protein
MHVGSGRIRCSCNSRKRESVSPSLRFTSDSIRFELLHRVISSSLLFSSFLSCAAISTGVGAPQQSDHRAVRPSHPTHISPHSTIASAHTNSITPAAARRSTRLVRRDPFTHSHTILFNHPPPSLYPPHAISISICTRRICPSAGPVALVGLFDSSAAAVIWSAATLCYEVIPDATIRSKFHLDPRPADP